MKMDIRMRADGYDHPEISEYSDIETEYDQIADEARSLAAATGKNVTVYSHGCPDEELFRVNGQTGVIS